MSAPRVIVHAGFHKTGTTSAQRFLRANGKNIWPRCALVLPGRVRNGAALMAVRYSRFGTLTLLDEFARDLHETLAQIDLGNRNVLISEESFVGRMPGRDGQLGYHAAPAILARAESVIHDVFGPQARVIFQFSTRSPQSWLRSTYKHNVRVSRLTDDWDSYHETYAASADLLGTAQAVGKAVSGQIRNTDLATMGGPEGTAAPLLDLIELPDHRRRKLLPMPNFNVGPSDAVTKKLLDLNRSAMNSDTLKAAKSALLKEHNV